MPRRPTTRGVGSRLQGPFLTVAALLATACADPGVRSSSTWSGTVDTLPSGQIVVHNTGAPVWGEGEAWTVVEELRIGSLDGDGPEVLGRVTSLEVDGAGRIWVLEGQAQELRVFDSDGHHVRTVGRRGGGPGELASAVRVDLAPDGTLWVMDPSNNRISIFDTAGAYVDGRYAVGGFVILPWPGRFDARGRYYAPAPDFTGGSPRFPLVRHDHTMTVLDTLFAPRDPVERRSYVHPPSGPARMSAGVPFQGSLRSRLSPDGTMWALITDQYRLFELDDRGDTLRTITRTFTPLPVTREDREEAEAGLKWFTDQGGRIDLSWLPDTKPAAAGFFLDDEGHVWVELTTPRGEQGTRFEVFAPDGRVLGVVTLPFPLGLGSPPIVRGTTLYGVTRDELEVPYVVRARIVRPGAG